MTRQQYEDRRVFIIIFLAVLTLFCYMIGNLNIGTGTNLRSGGYILIGNILMVFACICGISTALLLRAHWSRCRRPVVVRAKRHG